jgi:hypothetical protein
MLGPQVAGTLRITLATRSLQAAAAAAARTQTSTEARVPPGTGAAARMTFTAILPALTGTN